MPTKCFVSRSMSFRAPLLVTTCVAALAIGLSGCGANQSAISSLSSANSPAARPAASSTATSATSSTSNASTAASAAPTTAATGASSLHASTNSAENFPSFGAPFGPPFGGGFGFGEKRPRLVGYLPNYDGSYADFAKSLDWTKMTHLYLALGNPAFCDGTCTSASDTTISLGQSDAEIKAIVDAAHRHHVQVILSIGGGGGDQQILQFYDAGLSWPLVKSINTFIHQHNLDGVDVDIEDPGHMGAPDTEFVKDLLEVFHPQHKIVTAAVAQWIQDGMEDKALHMFDFINVMNYSNLSDAQDAMQYYSQTKHVPKDRMTLGVPFFGTSSDGNYEETYSTILQVYPNAWQADSVSGGDLDGGITFYYVGEATMAKETQYGKKFGGIMIWELSQDGRPPHSLLDVIQRNL